MSDLVKRLSEWSPKTLQGEALARIAELEAEKKRLIKDANYAGSLLGDRCEALETRIAKLEAALREIEEYYLTAGVGYDAEDVYNIARDALKTEAGR